MSKDGIDNSRNVLSWRDMSAERQESLFAELDHDRTVLRTINAFAVDLIAIPSRQELAWYMARQVVGKLGFDDCVIYFLDDDKNVLRQHAAIGENKNPVSNVIENPLKISLGEGISGHVALTKKPLIIDDLEKDSRYIPDIEPARSEICVPLLVDDKAIGVIDCEDRRVAHFNEFHLEILSTVSAMASAKFKLLEQSLATETAEEQVRVRDTWLRSILKNSPIEIVLKDTEGRIVAISDNVPGVLGFDKNDFIGKTTADFLPRNIADVYMAADRQVIETGEPTHLEVKEEPEGENWYSPNGKPSLQPGKTPRYSLNEKFPLQDENGEIIGICSLTTDITDIKQASEEKRELEDVVQALIEYSPVPISVKDTEGNYTYISPAYSEYLDIAAEDATGQKSSGVLESETAARLQEADEVIKKTGRPLANDETFSVQLGPSVLQVTKFPVKDSSGKVTGICTVGMDVTAQIETGRRLEKQSEALRENERLLFEAQRIAAIGHWRWSEDGERLEHCSKQMAKNFGMTVEEMLSQMKSHQSFMDIIHPDDKTRVDRAIKTFIDSSGEVSDPGSLLDIEYRINTPGGELRHIREIAEKRIDDQGSPSRTVGAVQDITELVTVRDDLIRHRDQLEDIVGQRTAELRQKSIMVEASEKAARYGHWMWDEASGVCTYCSAGLARVHGMSVEEYIEAASGTEIPVGLCLPEDLPQLREVWREIYENHAPYSLDYRFQDKNGDIRWINEIGHPMDVSDDGVLLTSVGITRDITDTIDAEKKLTDLSAAIDSMTEPVVVFDAEDRFSFTNRAFRTLNEAVIETIQPGETFEDHIRAVVDRGLAPAAIGQEEEWIRQRLERHRSPSTPFEILRQDDRWLLCIEQPLPSGGLVLLLTDITRQKEVQEELEQARDQAELANRAKSDFMSSMSHELRTPMNAILGFAQLLEMGAKEKLSEQQAAYVGYILKSGSHLLELIDSVLELNKIESGQLSLSMAHTSLREITNKSLNMIHARAREEGITIIDETAHEDVPVLWTDSTRLTQVLLNLLSNAVKYNREQGSITLSLETRPEGLLRVRVADTGDGIPMDKQDDLFKPFERLGREAGEIEGSGIGLLISKQIVERLGGSIGFKSSEGEGSTFWIDVPYSEEAAPTGEDETVSENPGQTGTEGNNEDKDRAVQTVLYVEDNPANTQLMEAIMAQFDGVRLLTAPDAETGLGIAKTESPDLILMDINLPGMSGIEALNRLLEDERTHDIPVIAITAAVMPKEVEAGKQAGFHDYIAKPINVAEFTRSIGEVLNKKRK